MVRIRKPFETDKISTSTIGINVFFCPFVLGKEKGTDRESDPS